MPNFLKLENIGKIAVGGFGEKAIQGLLMSMLNELTPEKAYSYITTDSQLLKRVNEVQWHKFSNMAHKANLKPITMDIVRNFLSEKRIDLLSIVVNTPNGEEWLSKQVDFVNTKLGLV